MTAYDARTVEAAAKVVEDFASAWETSPLVLEARAAGTGARSIAAAIRALPVSPGPTSEREISDSRHAALYPNTPPPSLEAVVASYWDAHEDAREMGYPSMTEALEALSEFREEQGPTPSDALGETVEKMREALAALEASATEVARYGAQTGPQWPKMTTALIKARAALAFPLPMKED